MDKVWGCGEISPFSDFVFYFCFSFSNFVFCLFLLKKKFLFSIKHIDIGFFDLIY